MPPSHSPPSRQTVLLSIPEHLTSFNVRSLSLGILSPTPWLVHPSYPLDLSLCAPSSGEPRELMRTCSLFFPSHGPTYLFVQPPITAITHLLV